MPDSEIASKTRENGFEIRACCLKHISHSAFFTKDLTYVLQVYLENNKLWSYIT
jgi:hypothetical protein